MKPSFLSQALTIRDIFGRHFQYVIPLYQRPYSWEIKQSERLLDDLVAAMGEEPGVFLNKSYFMGAIILTGAPSNKMPAEELMNTFQRIIAENDPPMEVHGEYAVVDGKQRLITLQILLCLLRDMSTLGDQAEYEQLIGDGSEANPWRIFMPREEGAFFQRYVLAPGSSLETVDQDVLPLSQRNIKQVRDALFETLSDISEEQRSSLHTYVADHCTVVDILTTEFNNAYQIFLSINDRGTQLARGDILKAELMSQINDDLRHQYEEILETWNDSLGEPETTRSGKKTFFNHFWYALTGNPTNMLEDIRKQVETSGGAVPFIDNLLVPYAAAYQVIKNKQWGDIKHKAEIERILGQLDWLPHDEWMSTLMMAIFRHKGDPDYLVQIMRKVERLAYSLLIQPIGAQNRRKRYNSTRRSLRDNDGKIDPLKELELSASEKRISLKTVTHGLHRSHSSAAKLVLLRLDMQQSGKDVAYYNGIQTEEGFSVEHMLPRSPRKNTRWFTLFPDEEKRNHYKELLGNLFLVYDKSENPTMKNYDYSTKQEILFNNKGDHPMSLTHDLKTTADWAPADIDARQAKLMKMINELWDLEG